MNRTAVRLLLTMALVASVIALAHPAYAAGELDITFDGEGKAVTSFGGSFDSARAVAVQPDDKIVTVGLMEPGFPTALFAVARFNSNGSLDSTFDGDGRVTTAFSTHAVANATALQPDGKIIAAGYTTSSPGAANADFALARYNSDGSLDSTFDGDGKLVTDFGGGHEVANAVTVQPDGKIVVAGQRGTAPDCSCSVDFALARYNSDGSLDSTFDGDGKLTTDFGSNSDIATAIARQADGKLVAAGHGSSNFALARYNSDGSLDAAFDGDGKVMTDFAGSSADHAQAVALQTDGKVVAAGNTNAGGGGGNFALARYNSDGSLDAAFDGDGKVATDFAGASEGANGIALQSNGKVVAAGSTPGIGGPDFALARYNSDGSLDAAFDGDGKVTTDFASTNDQAFAVALQADGKIVAAGGSPGGTNNFEVARYVGDSEVTCDDAVPTIVGTEDDDILMGTEGDDVIFGLGGNDEIYAGGGNDIICGGPGDDGAAGDVGNDLIDGGPGFDFGWFHDAPAALTLDLAAGSATGWGTDTLVDIEGAVGGEFDDSLTGNSGFNWLDGRGGDDTLDGGPGFDVAGFFDAPGPVTASLVTGTATGEGSDVLVGFEGLAGGFFGDTLIGNGGDNVFIPRGGDDTLDGGSGNDGVRFEVGPVVVNLTSGKATGEGSDVLKSLEGVLGTESDDTIVGNAQSNSLAGGGGDDAISGGAGDDELDGGAGSDALSGGPGSDTCTNGEFVVGCELGDPVSVAFGTFTAQVEMDLGLLVNDTFEAKGAFTVGAASDGIDPLTEPVGIEVGPYSTTIPGGSFQLDKFGNYVFENANFSVLLRPLGAGSLAYTVEGKNAELVGTTNPVEVALAVGNDAGTTTDDAEIKCGVCDDLPSFEGDKIGFFGGDLTLPASGASYVRNGWIFPLEDTAEEPGWLNLSVAERQERLDDAVWRFELFVDGEPIPLDGAIFLDTFDGVPGVAKFQFVQFKTDEFEPGTTHEFRGVWYGDTDDDVSEVVLDLTINVTFT